MTQTPTITSEGEAVSLRLKAEPPLHSWLENLQSASTVNEVAQPRIVTGHQPVFYHPGILSKYLAAQLMAGDGEVENWVVDQDVLDPFAWPLPLISLQQSSGGEVVQLRRRHEPLIKETAHHHDRMIPTCMQPPVDWARLEAAINELIKTQTCPPGLFLFQKAIADLSGMKSGNSPTTLAEQVIILRDAILAQSGMSINIRHRYASKLFSDPEAESILDHMLLEPERATKTYLKVIQNSQEIKGVGLLTHTAQRMELPIWALSWMEPRTRIYACVETDGISYEVNGERLGIAALKEKYKLAPRALLLTGLLRLLKSDVFIHGLGGGIYDGATEAWFADWLGVEIGSSLNENPPKPEGQILGVLPGSLPGAGSLPGGGLAEKRVISCDLFLDAASLGIPQKIPQLTQQGYEKTLWRKHHVPHNLDRELLEYGGPPAPEVKEKLIAFRQEKERLLAAMDLNRDKAFRAACFQSLHQINHQLQAMFPQIMASLERDREQAHLALENDRILSRRDWPFFVYDANALEALKRAIVAAFRSDHTQA